MAGIFTHCPFHKFNLAGFVKQQLMWVDGLTRLAFSLSFLGFCYQAKAEKIPLLLCVGGVDVSLQQ